MGGLPSAVHLLAACSIPVYLFCLLWPQQALVNWLAIFLPQNIELLKRWMVIGVASFAALVFMAAPFLRGNTARLSAGLSIFWLLTMVWILLSTAWSLNPQQTFLYGATLAVLLVAGAIFWNLPDRTIELSSALGVLVAAAALAFLFAKLPLVGRNLGGISPNGLGHMGLTLIALGYLRQGKIQWLSAVIGLWIMVVSQSRTVFLAALIFLALYHFVVPAARSRSGAVSIAFGIAAAVIVLVLLLEPVSNLAASISSQMLGVTDAQRTSSGFSGRDVSWQLGYETLKGHEISGFGFRTRGSMFMSQAGDAINAHSGLINAMLDIGIIGMASYFGLVGYCAWRMFADWATRRNRYDRVGASFIVCMTPILLLEPNYLNFGSASHFMLLLFLARPLFIRQAAASTPVRAKAAKAVRKRYRWGDIQAARAVAQQDDGEPAGRP